MIKDAPQKVTVNHLSSNHPLSSIKIGDYTLFYDNPAAEAIYEEIFIEKSYDFETTNPNPVIIDAGCNIGLATVFFKIKYPNAKILCFEPDPHTFQLLTKNIEYNHLSQVSLFNAALAPNAGTIPFYGQVGRPGLDARGNSIIAEWGCQRTNSAQINVASVCLSSYINQPIDFLKLDIEGAEQAVLEELGDKLDLIDALVIEIHEIQDAKAQNSEQAIRTLLEKYNFDVEAIPLNHELPPEIKAWVQKSRPAFSLIKAQKKL